MKLQALFFSLVPVSSACLQHLQARSQNAPSSTLLSYHPSNLTKTAIHNVRVFNGTAMTPPQTVVIDGDHIGTAEDASSCTTTIDGTGHFLIPGLIDSHLHLNTPADLLNLTQYGVTTALQMNCPNYTACDLLRNHEGLTDFRTAGFAAIGNGSQHANMFKLSPDKLFYPNSNATEYVDNAFAAGADYYKITAEEPNGPSAKAQKQLVSAVHAHGHMSMTHAADLQAYDDASASGTDGIQHVPKDGLLSAALVQRIKHNPRQFVTPTLNIFHQALINPAVNHFLGGGAFNANVSMANALANAGLLHCAGIPILAGTDSVGDLRPLANLTIEFGKTLHEELGLLVQAGMSAAEALDAATRVAAKWHRLDDRGVVETGKRADLVLLGSNPLEDIANTFDLKRVWVAGREYRNVTMKGN